MEDLGSHSLPKLSAREGRTLECILRYSDSSLAKLAPLSLRRGINRLTDFPVSLGLCHLPIDFQLPELFHIAYPPKK